MPDGWQIYDECRCSCKPRAAVGTFINDGPGGEPAWHPERATTHVTFVPHPACPWHRPLVLTRPTKKARAQFIYIDAVMDDTKVLYHNMGNWDWVEHREFITVCQRCRVVYPPGAKHCPAHGPTVQIPARFLSLAL